MQNKLAMIQKSGLVTMEAQVMTRAREGWALYGSPFIMAGLPTQLMRYTGTKAKDPGYYSVTHSGATRLPEMVEPMLEQGWKMYMEPYEFGGFAVQTMIRGDIAYLPIEEGGGSGGTGNPAPQDWEKEIARVDGNITEIYAVLNSLPDPQPNIDKAEARAKAYTDEQIAAAGVKIDAKFEKQDNQINQVWDAVEQRYSDAQSTIRGEVAGMTGRMDTVESNIETVAGKCISLSADIEVERRAREKDITNLTEYVNSGNQQQQIYIDNSLNSMNESMAAQYMTLLDKNHALESRVTALEAARMADNDRFEGMMQVLLSDMAEVKAKAGPAWK